MKTNPATIALLLGAVAGALVQLAYWQQPRGTGMRGVGEVIVLVMLLGFCVVTQFRRGRLHKFNLYSGPIGALLVLVILGLMGWQLWSAYTHYYGPLADTAGN